MYQNAIFIRTSWLAKFADIWWQNADDSRTQDVCHVIHVFF